MKLWPIFHTQASRIAHWLDGRGYREVATRLRLLLARIGPNEPRDLFYQAQKLRERGHTDAALVRLQRLLQDFPHFAQAHFEYGWLLQQADRDSEAVDAFDQALLLGAPPADCHGARALSLLKLERFQEAEVSFRRAILLEPDNFEAMYNLGLLLAGLDRFSDAMECYRGALSARPDASASVALAQLLEGAGRFAEAEEVLRHGLVHNPTDPQITSLLAARLYKQGQTEAALNMLRSAEATAPMDVIVVSTLVQVLIEGDQNDEAIAAAERLCQSNTDKSSQTILGWVYLQTDRPARALELFDSVLTVEDQSDISRAEVLGLRAAALGLMGRSEEAAGIFAELEQHWPQVFLRNADLREYAARFARSPKSASPD